MAGTVWEWTSSAFEPYPYNADNGRESADSTELRVRRGGSWLCAHSYRGFRLARSVPSAEAVSISLLSSQC